MSDDNRASLFHRFQFTFPIEYSGRRRRLAALYLERPLNVSSGGKKEERMKGRTFAETPLSWRSSIRQDGAMGARFRGLQETQFVLLLCETNSQFRRHTPCRSKLRLKMSRMETARGLWFPGFFAVGGKMDRSKSKVNYI
ncbi:hypothetical protein Trydic_g11273 [Trypoxylus dichotomus]